MTEYIEQNNPPLCPQTDDPLHALAVKILNAMYDVMDRDSDGESPQDQQKLYEAANKSATAWMRLYRVQSTPSINSRARDVALGGRVEAWYFKCPTCKYTVPASGIRRKAN